MHRNFDIVSSNGTVQQSLRGSDAKTLREFNTTFRNFETRCTQTSIPARALSSALRWFFNFRVTSRLRFPIVLSTRFMYFKNSLPAHPSSLHFTEPNDRRHEHFSWKVFNYIAFSTRRSEPGFLVIQLSILKSSDRTEVILLWCVTWHAADRNDLQSPVVYRKYLGRNGLNGVTGINCTVERLTKYDLQ